MGRKRYQGWLCHSWSLGILFFGAILESLLETWLTSSSSLGSLKQWGRQLQPRLSAHEVFNIWEFRASLFFVESCSFWTHVGKCWGWKGHSPNLLSQDIWCFSNHTFLLCVLCLGFWVSLFGLFLVSLRKCSVSSQRVKKSHSTLHFFLSFWAICRRRGHGVIEVKDWKPSPGCCSLSPLSKTEQMGFYFGFCQSVGSLLFGDTLGGIDVNSFGRKDRGPQLSIGWMTHKKVGWLFFFFSPS